MQQVTMGDLHGRGREEGGGGQTWEVLKRWGHQEFVIE